MFPFQQQQLPQEAMQQQNKLPELAQQPMQQCLLQEQNDPDVSQLPEKKVNSSPELKENKKRNRKEGDPTHEKSTPQPKRSKALEKNTQKINQQTIEIEEKANLLIDALPQKHEHEKGQSCNKCETFMKQLNATKNLIETASEPHEVFFSILINKNQILTYEKINKEKVESKNKNKSKKNKKRIWPVKLNSHSFFYQAIDRELWDIIDSAIRIEGTLMPEKAEKLNTNFQHTIFLYAISSSLPLASINSFFFNYKLHHAGITNTTVKTPIFCQGKTMLSLLTKRSSFDDKPEDLDEIKKKLIWAHEKNKRGFSIIKILENVAQDGNIMLLESLLKENQVRSAINGMSIESTINLIKQATKIKYNELLDILLGKLDLPPIGESGPLACLKTILYDWRRPNYLTSRDYIMDVDAINYSDNELILLYKLLTKYPFLGGSISLEDIGYFYQKGFYRRTQIHLITLAHVESEEQVEKKISLLLKENINFFLLKVDHPNQIILMYLDVDGKIWHKHLFLAGHQLEVLQTLPFPAADKKENVKLSISRAHHSKVIFILEGLISPPPSTLTPLVWFYDEYNDCKETYNADFDMEAVHSVISLFEIFFEKNNCFNSYEPNKLKLANLFVECGIQVYQYINGKGTLVSGKSEFPIFKRSLSLIMDKTGPQFNRLNFENDLIKCLFYFGYNVITLNIPLNPSFEKNKYALLLAKKLTTLEQKNSRIEIFKYLASELATKEKKTSFQLQKFFLSNLFIYFKTYKFPLCSEDALFLFDAVSCVMWNIQYQHTTDEKHQLQIMLLSKILGLGNVLSGTHIVMLLKEFEKIEPPKSKKYYTSYRLAYRKTVLKGKEGMIYGNSLQFYLSTIINIGEIHYSSCVEVINYLIEQGVAILDPDYFFEIQSKKSLEMETDIVDEIALERYKNGHAKYAIAYRFLKESSDNTRSRMEKAEAKIILENQENVSLQTIAQDTQSTHNRTVHSSVATSAKNLYEYHFPRSLAIFKKYPNPYSLIIASIYPESKPDIKSIVKSLSEHYKFLPVLVRYEQPECSYFIYGKTESNTWSLTSLPLSDFSNILIRWPALKFPKKKNPLYDFFIYQGSINLLPLYDYLSVNRKAHIVGSIDSMSFNTHKEDKEKTTFIINLFREHQFQLLYEYCRASLRREIAENYRKLWFGNSKDIPEKMIENYVNDVLYFDLNATEAFYSDPCSRFKKLEPDVVLRFLCRIHKNGMAITFVDNVSKINIIDLLICVWSETNDVECYPDESVRMNMKNTLFKQLYWAATAYGNTPGEEMPSCPAGIFNSIVATLDFGGNRFVQIYQMNSTNIGLYVQDFAENWFKELTVDNKLKVCELVINNGDQFKTEYSQAIKNLFHEKYKSNFDQKYMGMETANLYLELLDNPDYIFGIKMEKDLLIFMRGIFSELPPSYSPAYSSSSSSSAYLGILERRDTAIQASKEKFISHINEKFNKNINNQNSEKINQERRKEMDWITERFNQPFYMKWYEEALRMASSKPNLSETGSTLLQPSSIMSFCSSFSSSSSSSSTFFDFKFDSKNEIPENKVPESDVFSANVNPSSSAPTLTSMPAINSLVTSSRFFNSSTSTSSRNFLESKNESHDDNNLDIQRVLLDNSLWRK